MAIFGVDVKNWKRMVESDEVVEYLRQRGAVEILVWLSVESRRFTDLFERVDIARATLSKRLEKGVGLGLVGRESPDDSEGSDSRQYRITDRGRELLNGIDRAAAVRHLQSLYNARQDVESDRQALLSNMSRSEESNDDSVS